MGVVEFCVVCYIVRCCVRFVVVVVFGWVSDCVGYVVWLWLVVRFVVVVEMIVLLLLGCGGGGGCDGGGCCGCYCGDYDIVLIVDCDVVKCCSFFFYFV